MKYLLADKRICFLLRDTAREKQYLFFNAVKQRNIPFLLDYPTFIKLWFVKGLLRKQCWTAPFTNHRLVK